MYNRDSTKKTYLKGKFEIESFFEIIMMASDGLKHEIEFTDDPINDNEQIDYIVNSTSSSTVSALATFYGNTGVPFEVQNKR